MKKQTAVEWFFSELERMQYFIGNDMLEAYKEAKAMEKSQILDAYVYGSAYGTDTKQGFSAVNYFESTYGK